MFSWVCASLGYVDLKKMGYDKYYILSILGEYIWIKHIFSQHYEGTFDSVLRLVFWTSKTFNFVIFTTN
jgi:hypothetical protein